MTTSAIDEVAQLIATRRLALRGGAALLLGLPYVAQHAEAKCKRPGARCKRSGRCCAGARCKHRRCRCKGGHNKWAGVCCKHRFALQDDAFGPDDPYIPGTEFCCPGKNICQKDGNPKNDDCCQEKETCLNNECCCDGCRGTVICGGVCCGSSSCCNGECCGEGQVCDGENGCVDGQVDCVSNADCSGADTCVDSVCCSPDRVCYDGNCCGPDHFCDHDKKSCCPNGAGCTTGKKVRIRV
jgi:hypothetical protein